MNFEPQKFFVGLMDFFSILLPGALLTWLLDGEVGPAVLGDRLAVLTDARGWVAFLFASYLFGHLIFLLGSWLDELYDWVRLYTLNTQVRLLSRGGRLLPLLARALIWLVFKRERNLALNCAAKLKQQGLGPLQAKDAINTFQWSKALLNIESPTSLAVVQCFEADSKFFRCFTVMLLLLLVAWPWQGQWATSGVPIVLALLLLSLWRYMEQRHKATNQAYWSVITLAAKDGKIALNKSSPEARNASYAGGVVFRLRGRKAEYLLVEATDDLARWTLPRGHAEEGEQLRETAVREVLEKAGVWARVDHDLDVKTWSSDEGTVTTRIFLMQAVGYGLRRDKDGEHVWLPLQDAIAKVSIETRKLLQAAGQHRSDLGASPALAASTTST